MILNIIGKGSSWKLAPLEGETWGVNDLFLRRDVTLIFQMHRPRLLKNLFSATAKYVNGKNIPVVMLEKRPDIPTSIRFPLEEMHTDYFTNSFSYMLAYAIHKGATVINLYGCVLKNESAYQDQKPNIEYWIGYARGRGVEVNVHGFSNLLRAKDGLLYGYNAKQAV